MAEFCKQCSIELFGKDFNDLAGLSTADDTSKELFPVVLCEGCGVIQVNHVGECVSLDCLKKHNRKEESNVCREIVIDGDEKSACSKVSIKFADKLKDIVFNNLVYIAKNLGTYTPTK